MSVCHLSGSPRGFNCLQGQSFKTRMIVLTAMLGITLVGSAFSADESLNEDSYSFRITDDTEQPVEGAIIAVSAVLDLTGNKKWTSPQLARTNAKGLAKFVPDPLLVDESMFVIWHPKRKLGAIVNPMETDIVKVNDIKLIPLKTLEGQVFSSELAKLNRGTGTLQVMLTVDDRRVLTIQSGDSPLKFSMPVTDGRYDLQVMSPSTYAYQIGVDIKEANKAPSIGEIDLVPTRISVLAGQPAPELSDIASWKNSAPVSLEELKGNVVILDFWGYWCGPCVASMPAMMKLHDEYSKQGLRIIAVHVDSDDGKVVNPTELDRRIERVKNGLWKGRDLPFPVAITKVKKVPYGPGVDGEAINKVVADYGVMFFPTGVIINRRGEVVKNFSHHDPADLALLERLIAEGGSEEKPAVQKTSGTRRVRTSSLLPNR